MYSFEGDFRRKPQQNLAGASAQRQTNRDALIQQSQQQRQKREEQRRRLNATVKIQAYVRSYLTRKHCKQHEREDFDHVFRPTQTEYSDQALIPIVAKLLFFYDIDKDCSRLVSVSQVLLKQWKKVLLTSGASVQIRRLLALHLRLLKREFEVPLAVPLRMFEVFTSVSSVEDAVGSNEALSSVGNTFLYLVKRGYFKDLRDLICDRTPPLYGPSINPPTPLCGALLDLIHRPVSLTMRVNNLEYSETVMTEFASIFLCQPYPEPVELFVIPALGQDPNKKFPFLALIQCLQDENKYRSGKLVNDSWLLHSVLGLEPPDFSLGQDPNKKFPFLALIQCLQDENKYRSGKLVNDSWLLHSVLGLEPPDFLNDIRNINNTRLPHNPIVLDYLKLIAKLTCNVCNKQITYEYEDSLYSQETAADKDDDSDSDTEPNPTSVREQKLLTRCIELLNEPERCVMSTCAQITDSDLGDDFLDPMADICHNLLLSHRMALHKYRLLYTLAFKPVFLRGLWKWLSSMSHESSFGGSATPLLSALSRGMGAEGSVIGVHRLLAPLAVFCALFSLLIGTLHDTEFCRDVDDDEKMSLASSTGSTGGSGNRVHAFEFSELGALCRTLRQVCLGLVELAYPESRPPVLTGQYKDAVGHKNEIAAKNQTPAWSHLFKLQVCLGLVELAYPESRPPVLTGQYKDAVGHKENQISAKNQTPAWSHLFKFSQLGALCRTLRQVCLGLVELAYPESRPPVLTGQYKDAVGHKNEIAAKNQTPAWSHLFKVYVSVPRIGCINADHAFEFSELGALCRTLRQVCLGLVELAYPESRPPVLTGQYKDAVGHKNEIAAKNQTPAWSHLFKLESRLRPRVRPLLEESAGCSQRRSHSPVELARRLLNALLAAAPYCDLFTTGLPRLMIECEIVCERMCERFSELGALCRTLRQVCLGLVELAYPESRPPVLTGQYKDAVGHKNEIATKNQTPAWSHLFKIVSFIKRGPGFIGSLNDSVSHTKRERETKILISFSKDQIIQSLCLGLVELAYPESRPPVLTGQYKDAVGHKENQISVKNQTPAWSHLFKFGTAKRARIRARNPFIKAPADQMLRLHPRGPPRGPPGGPRVCTHLLRALYVRDSRLDFCAGWEWPVEGAVPEGAAAIAIFAGMTNVPAARRRRMPDRTLAMMSTEEGPPLTIKEQRTVTILREIPFVVPFSTRVLIFQGLLIREKHDHWYEMASFNEGPAINISVRRSHLYEDAFDKLSPDNEPDMKLKMRVQLINQAGAEEAGIDGGGLFREFISELLKSAFDPNRGLFRLTRDNMLYPNPGVHLLYDDFPMHYYFVGRMLGKALYENLLVELPLAEFFLGKLCSSRDPDVHALASLDPGLYRGLLMLKSHKRQDVPDLGLDFTIVSDELGEQRIEELKPGGANIPVTAENRIEYIHLVADYKLNRQIRAQCNAFKRGLMSVVNGEWLRMFSCRELQLLISGSEVPIDIEDMKRNIQYAGGFSAEHPTIQHFWKVVENFTDQQKRQLLKFVTSCSRPPLLGFKDLQPQFCIQSAGTADRLPSSSTCMNLLKLPEFDSEEILAERLLYAIQAGAGFELS
ncbi:HECT-domain (ubiquitin-transferase) domain-containing protein [Phthorimaea operculella]|nr:HECT-domain (ubiquitin-transferase) domain-containing protein [Phthorimaea operculella]